MNRAVLASVAAASIAAAGAGLVVAGAQRPPASAIAMVTPAAAEGNPASIYFQDPDGKPAYSLTPRKTPDGRDYRAVPAGADVSFDEAAPEVTPPAAAAGATSARSNTSAIRWDCRTRRRCRRKTPWGWTTSPFTKARTATMGRCIFRTARSSARAPNPRRW